MKKRTAKVLLGLTAFLFPWDIHLFGDGIGWGVSFVFGEFNSTPWGNGTKFINFILKIADSYDASNRAAIYMWLTAFVFALVAILYLTGARVGERIRDSGSDSEDTVLDKLLKYEDLAVGILFVASALLFIVSRVSVYSFNSSSPDWLTIPVGAVYAGGVGMIFILSYSGKTGEISDRYSRAGIAVLIIFLVAAPASVAVQASGSTSEDVWAREDIVFDSANDRIGIEWRANGVTTFGNYVATSNRYDDAENAFMVVNISVLEDRGEPSQNTTIILRKKGDEAVISSSGVSTRGMAKIRGNKSGKVSDGDLVEVKIQIEIEGKSLPQEFVSYERRI